MIHLDLCIVSKQALPTVEKKQTWNRGINHVWSCDSITRQRHGSVNCSNLRERKSTSKADQSRLESFAAWFGGGVSSAFFSSLEKSSCVGLSVTDSDDEVEDGQELLSGHRKSDQPLPDADAAGDWSTDNLVTTNPWSDQFSFKKLHHVEFWCGDASNTWRRFCWGLGMHLVAKSDQSTGNQTFCTYVVQSNELVFSFTAPYSKQVDQSNSKLPHGGFSADEANSFFEKHGLAVRAVGVLVEDAEKAFRVAVENGAVGILDPVVLTQGDGGGRTKMAELKLCGDVVLRLISNHGFIGPYLPNFEPVVSVPFSYGIRKLDHVVGGVAGLIDAGKYLGKFAGLHKSMELPSGRVGTIASARNGLVLANNNEIVVLPVSEPGFETKSKSEIQTFLEHNDGSGLQHLALVCDDMFSTLKEMRMRTEVGGFDFMPKPPSTYYKNLPDRVKGSLTDKQCKECEELGVLVYKEEQGVLLKTFTKPIGDRPTLVIEIIQKVGFIKRSGDGQFLHKVGSQAFGKCNF